MAGFWSHLAALHLASILWAEAALIVKLRNGKVRGFSEKVGGVTITGYLGIQYAEPPVGDLRFSRPQPVKPWKGVLEAVRLPNSCEQFVDELLVDSPGIETWEANTILDEDCLYLNVWTPATESDPDPTRTVMVWIHGGGFTMGTSTSDIYNGKILAAQYDVVVVSMNYRMGGLGFLYFGVEDAPGNMGLLDQQLALKWVASNIRSFGGDPDRVTLFGESAGGASVGYHLLSPGSASLFKYAILQSGSPLAHWAHVEPSVALERSKTFAQKAGCKRSSIEEMIKCLKTTDINKMRDFWGTIRPTNDGVFMQSSPGSRLSKAEFKQTNIMIGVTADELTLGLYVMFPHLLHLNGTHNFSKQNFDEVVSKVISYTYSNKNLETAAKLEYTLKNMKSVDNYLELAEDFWGDCEISCPTVRFADRYARNGNKVFMYYLDHRPQISPWPKWMGSTHGIDIFYVFGTTPFEEQDNMLSRLIQKYWTTFAERGSPDGDGSVTWPPYIGPDHPTRVLDLTPNHVKNNILTRRCAFWNKLVPQLLEQSKINGDQPHMVHGSLVLTSFFIALIFLY